ncbi:MAG: lysylphosphatidylglycerol synthase transmembrane domain-containing protein [Gemmatimonas sp.]|nr:lysylphosphatidylglycerol synthase transmembrane domain-containing protein [Gemmatimonadaceae bacterium]
MTATTRRTLLRVLQLALAAIIVALVVRRIVAEWGAVTLALDQARPNWLALCASGLVVLATYAVLIETWRVVLRGWQHDIPFLDAARIWTISNLGKYLPGKVWSITALAVMSREYGVTAAEGATASVLVTLINTLIGFAVAIITGASLLRLSPLVVIVIAVMAIAVLASPSALPTLGVVAGRVFKREIVLRPLDHRVLLSAGALTCIAWLMYGVAFWLFTKGVLGAAPGALRDYVAVFAGSYLIGFVAIFSPAGVGVREGAMALALQRAGFAAGPAYLLVVASRLWLTALEVIPPLIFLAFVRRSRLSTHEEEHSPTR